MIDETTGAGRLTLDEMARRILGVLIEKALTTPNQYPMTVNALISGCNQKSNREPVVRYLDEPVFDQLASLDERGLIASVALIGSRVEKYRQELTATLDLEGGEKGVIAELLLRGPQTTGELRQRASRMVRIPDSKALDDILEGLLQRNPPLVVRLTPPGIKRGVRFTHNLYPDAELQQVLATEPEITATAPSRQAPAATPGAPPGGGQADLLERLDQLAARVEALEKYVGLHSDE